jgi:[acyl-carrier-protein] S-malonyltransferase
MVENGITDVVELGAGKVLSGIVKRSYKEINTVSVSTPADIEALVQDL